MLQDNFILQRNKVLQVFLNKLPHRVLPAVDFLLLNPATKSGIFFGKETLFFVWSDSLHGLAYSFSLTEFKYDLLSELLKEKKHEFINFNIFYTQS